MSDQEFDTEYERLSYELSQTNRRVTQLSERIDQLEYTVSQLVTDLPTQTKSKREKKYDILTRAIEDAPDGASRASISREKASGAADCSDRHARTLMRELSETFAWAKYAPNKQPARLLISFDGHVREEFQSVVDDAFTDVVCE